MNYQQLFLQLIPKTLIDIGAHDGSFSWQVKKINPDCRIIMVEANPNCESELKKIKADYEILGLSAQVGTADLYVEKKNKIATGASLYLENTEWYAQDKFETITINLDTLDNRNYFPNEVIDLIKMDVQGSELDILFGGRKTIKRTKFVILEVSTVEYNLGAPLMDVVVKKMREYEFRIEEILNFDKLGNGQIFQMDILFKNMYV